MPARDEAIKQFIVGDDDEEEEEGDLLLLLGMMTMMMAVRVMMRRRIMVLLVMVPMMMAMVRCVHKRGCLLSSPRLRSLQDCSVIDNDDDDDNGDEDDSDDSESKGNLSQLVDDEIEEEKDTLNFPSVERQR